MLSPLGPPVFYRNKYCLICAKVNINYHSTNTNQIQFCKPETNDEFRFFLVADYEQEPSVIDLSEKVSKIEISENEDEEPVMPIMHKEPVSINPLDVAASASSDEGLEVLTFAWLVS